MTDLEKVLERVEQLAKDKADGHLSLVRFTTGWQAEYGSPWGKSWWGKNVSTLREALERLLLESEGIPGTGAGGRAARPGGDLPVEVGEGKDRHPVKMKRMDIFIRSMLNEAILGKLESEKPLSSAEVERIRINPTGE